jgi:hypothetical protein
MPLASPVLVQVKAVVYPDRTGTRVFVPTLISETGVLERLLRYQLEFRSAMSLSWQLNLLRAVRLFHQYTTANQGMFDSPHQGFQAFKTALENGTVGVDGLDPSGLYWKPRPQYADGFIHHLTMFSSWSKDRYGTPELNPKRSPTAHEAFMAYLSWFHGNRASLLGHAQSMHAAALRAAEPINALPRSQLPTVAPQNPAFPADRFLDLIFNGFFRGQRNPNQIPAGQLRDALIAILMHGGGLRESEPFHLWFDDVCEHPQHPGLAWIRIGHPSLGSVSVKNKITGKIERTSKQDVLAAQGLKPRTRLIGQKHAGWKRPALDGKYFLEVHWAPRQLGFLFWRVWRLYLLQLTRIDIPHRHAFVVFKGPTRGEMYSLAHYDRAHAKAVRQIGLVPEKNLGTTEHGHRHAYATLLRLMGMKPVVIKRCMHHKSVKSQVVYTQPQAKEIHDELTAANSRLEAGEVAEPSLVVSKMAEDIALFAPEESVI